MPASNVQLEFFPEGGSMIAGLPAIIAFKATYSDGLPVNVRGKIMNGKGEIISAINPYHDGMGLLDFIPAHGEKYYAQLDDDQKSKSMSYLLPLKEGSG